MKIPVDAAIMSVYGPLTPLVAAVLRYMYWRAPSELTMSVEKYARLVDEIPNVLRFVKADVEKEHLWLCDGIITPLEAE